MTASLTKVAIPRGFENSSVMIAITAIDPSQSACSAPISEAMNLLPPIGY